MTEEMKNYTEKMSEIAKHIFDRAYPHIKSGREISIELMGKYIDMIKDSSEIMKNVAKIHHYYCEHPEEKV